MDSATDCPIILTEDFADKMANAFCDVIVKRAKLKRRGYFLQLGAFESEAEADAVLRALQSAVIKKGNGA
jgi:cell division protein FtsN